MIKNVLNLIQCILFTIAVITVLFLGCLIFRLFQLQNFEHKFDTMTIRVGPVLIENKHYSDNERLKNKVMKHYNKRYNALLKMWEWNKIDLFIEDKILFDKMTKIYVSIKEKDAIKKNKLDKSFEQRLKSDF